MEKPKMKKGNRQNCRPCGSPWTPPVGVTPHRCHNVQKNTNSRQAGDSKRQNSTAKNNLDKSALHLKYGRFGNQPNFGRPGRLATRQKVEPISMSMSTPIRRHMFETDIINKNIGQEFLIVNSERKINHHLTLSEIMHIDIKPPKKSPSLSPVYWATPLMNAKYKPTRVHTPKRM